MERNDGITEKIKKLIKITKLLHLGAKTYDIIDL